MGKYFLLAFVFALLALGMAANGEGSPAIGFGVSAGLCVLAAAVVERGKTPKASVGQ
ncbi:MAG: hypothetical protein AB8C95_05715 [Phycisphaeraceae bacterium]